jgi:hypothetical protein
MFLSAMIYCSQCGKEIPEGGTYCPYCGQKAHYGSFRASTRISEEDFIDYVGPRAEHYLVKFKKFQTTAADGFALTWHWPAFIFGFWWLLYRKLYVWALVALGLWLIPHLALPAWFVWGAVANYLYFRQAKREIGEYRSRLNAALPAGTLSEIGGVNRWVWVLGLIVSLIFIAGFGLSAVMLYRFLTQGYLTVEDYVEIGFSPGWPF